MNYSVSAPSRTRSLRSNRLQASELQPEGHAGGNRCTIIELNQQKWVAFVPASLQNLQRVGLSTNRSKKQRRKVETAVWQPDNTSSVLREFRCQTLRE